MLIYKAEGECRIKVIEEMKNSNTCPEEIHGIMDTYPLFISLRKEIVHLATGIEIARVKELYIN